MTNFEEVAATINWLRDNVHLSGTVSNGTWYYPPLVLDENGQLWGSVADHLERVLENRTALRCYYRSLQPDAPLPPFMGRAGHVAVVMAFVTNLRMYYQHLLPPAAVTTDLCDQAVALLHEADVLLDVVLQLAGHVDAIAAIPN